jgi:uncharacterized protein VirK/YbjX
MKKNLILVGNKLPEKEGLNNIIDSFDYVLRVSRMNYLGLTGYKINGIYLEANNIFKYIFKGGDNKEEIRRAKNIFMHEHWYEKFTEWNLFLTKEQYQNIEIINHHASINAIQFERPTSPLLILSHLLNSTWKNEYNIHLTCLDIEGRAELIDNNPFWNYHKGGGKNEENYLIELIEKKIITRIPDE